MMNHLESDAVLLGDSGYGIMPWLLTPYRNPETPQENAYNVLLKRERVIIERCFGQLKRRFPILQYVRVKLEKIPSLIISCAVLHNIAKYLQDPEHHGDDEPEDDLQAAYDDAPEERVLQQRGYRRRDEIKDVIFNLH